MFEILKKNEQIIFNGWRDINISKVSWPSELFKSQDPYLMGPEMSEHKTTKQQHFSFYGFSCIQEPPCVPIFGSDSI